MRGTKSANPDGQRYELQTGAPVSHHPIAVNERLRTRRLLIFFGKSGAGKDFVAGLFVREFGYHCYNADADLTPEMTAAIRQRREFTPEMRARYFEIVANRIKDFSHRQEKVAITQGLFKNQNRHDIRREIPLARWVWVDAAPEIIAARVRQRNSPVTPEYARKINALFEEPDFPCYQIINNGGVAALLVQARRIEDDWPDACHGRKEGVAGVAK